MFEFSRSVRRQVEFDGRKLVSVEGGGCSKRSNCFVLQIPNSQLAACNVLSLAWSVSGVTSAPSCLRLGVAAGLTGCSQVFTFSRFARPAG